MDDLEKVTVVSESEPDILDEDEYLYYTPFVLVNMDWNCLKWNCSSCFARNEMDWNEIIALLIQKLLFCLEWNETAVVADPEIIALLEMKLLPCLEWNRLK
jgi:hypothetical protein